MSTTVSAQPIRSLRAKRVVFAVIAMMMAYVIYHSESFLFDRADPAWRHYEALGWWLLPHGVAGACALILVPLQFSDRLRQRFALLHRIVGRLYVGGVLVLAPLGVYIQYFEETLGTSRSFTVATVVDAALLLVTTGIGLAFARKRMISQHRQWMTRSYAVALAFFEVRFILGVTGLDEPPDPAIAEIAVWSCVALSVLVGDVANQWYELRRAPRAAGARAAEASAARPAFAAARLARADE